MWSSKSLLRAEILPSVAPPPAFIRDNKAQAEGTRLDGPGRLYMRNISFLS